MITQVKIKPEIHLGMPAEYEFTLMGDKTKSWFNVTFHQGSKSYVLGSVICGNGFVPCEGTVVRPQLMEVLTAFYKLNIKPTATQL